MENKDRLTTVPISQEIKNRLVGYKLVKPNRKKYEHTLETIGDVLTRLMDSYDAHEG